VYHHPGEPLNYSYVDDSKQLPSLNSTLGCLIASTITYLFICWGFPFDWAWPTAQLSELLARSDDAVIYPCDDETKETERSTLMMGDNNIALDVQNVAHIFADGTHAVKGISFNIQRGEVLSFLGESAYKINIVSELDTQTE
jgi:hypothetical protein